MVHSRFGILASLCIAVLSLSLAGCSGESSAKKLDGVYHSHEGPIVITLKDGKATVTIANESQTLDYKVEGNKLTIMNQADGDAVFIINDDGTLTGQLGTFSKKS